MNDGIIFYKSHFDNIKDLNNDELGQIFRACMTGDTGAMAPHVKMAYNFIVSQIRRDEEKYANIVEKRRAAGRKGGIAKGKRNENQDDEEIANQANANFAKQKQANQANESININSNINNNNNININTKTNSNEFDINRESIESGCTAVAVPLPSLEANRDKFISSLTPYLDRYPQQMLDDFADYWTEPNKSRTRMRYQLEKTWDTARRLATWAKRENEWQRRQPQGNGKVTMFEEIARLQQTFNN